MSQTKQPTTQDAIFAFLADPASHNGQSVDRIDTHISTIFLVGTRVIKLKKAVSLPFLDFSSLGVREGFCRKEVDLNRRTAPNLYKGVEPIIRHPDGHFTLGGRGEVVDWAIIMERFDQENLLTRVAEQGNMNRHMMLDLADAVAAFHRDAQPMPDDGGAEAMIAIITGNEESFRPFYGAVFNEQRVSALMERARGLARYHADRLNRRAASGMVRHCHGDLHLGNICLINGVPLLFDCIEFNDAFAVIDVFYDLAFLLMDLDAKGFRRQASILLNAYLDISGDYDGVPLLPLLLSMRAQIRAHVSAAIAQHMADPSELHRAAEDYLTLAETYLTAPPPSMIAVGGLSGSGKSRCARTMAPRLPGGVGAVVLRSDVLRKQIAGIHPTDRLPAEAYTAEASQAVYRAIGEQAQQLLANGQAVIIDAVFARPGERDAVEEAGKQAKVPFAGLWLEASAEVAEKRITTRVRNPSDATPEVLKAQLGYDLGPLHWSRIDSSGAKSDTDAHAWQAALAALSQPL
jgi:aminoglycoside phosphotransferase family enzyme/predicted kinase